MSGIFTSLTAASYALQTHSRSVEQAGKNIANINNPDYSRQRVITGNVGVVQTAIGPESGPLVAVGIQSVRDAFIERQILNEVAFTSSLSTLDFRLRQALTNLGENIDRINDPQFVADVSFDGGGLRGAIDTFFNAFESFSARPNDPTTKQVVVQAAQNMVDGFNRIDGRFERLQNNLESELNTEVSALNQLLAELSDLNREIARFEISLPGSANDLRDLRQAKLEEVAKYLLFETEEPADGFGQIELFVRDDNGDRQKVIGIGMDPQTVFYNSDLGNFSLSGAPAALDLQAGMLPSLLQVKNQYVANIRSDIDALANSIAIEVNRIYYQAFVPANPGPPPSDAVPEISFFQQPTPPPLSGTPLLITAGSIALYRQPSDATVTEFVPLTALTVRASATGISGANEVALAISGLSTQSQAALGGLKFSEFATRGVIELGQEILDVSNRLAVQKNVESILKDRRAEVSGVSMDEEVAQMIQFQRAFQASSRVFNVLSEMLDNIVNGLR